MLQGAAHEKSGHYAAAASSYHEAVRLYEQSTAADVHLALALNSLARADDELGRFSEAEHLYRRALTTLEKTGEPESPLYAVLLGNLGSLLGEIGEVTAAVTMLRESVAMHRRLLPADDKRVALIYNGLAEALLRERNYKEAEQRLNEASAILERAPHPGTELAITLSNLAAIKREHHRYKEAERLMERSVGLFEAEVGPDHPILVCGLNNLATMYSTTHRGDQADATFRKALALAEKYLGVHHPTYGSVLFNYSAFLRANGRKAEARTLEVQSKDVLRDSAYRNGLGMTVDASTLRAK
jgi:tetratricopeptide (TPR) repeat protein